MLNRADDLDDDVAPVPVWRRRKVQLAAGAGALLLLFIFTRGKPPVRPDDRKTAADYVGVVVPYQPAKAEPVVAEAPVKPAPAPVQAPQPPALPKLPTMAQPPAPQHPVMLAYNVKIDPPKPAAAGPAPDPKTGLDFK